MKIHVVFAAAIVQPLVQALQNREITISGTDITLEQFYIAAEAGKVEADIALIDASAGANKRDSIEILQKIRMCIPATRLIAILPDADIEWQKALGTYGIYDIYIAEQFNVDDVIHWINTRKTIADVPKLDIVVPSKRDYKATKQTSFHDAPERDRTLELPSWLRRKPKIDRVLDTAKEVDQVTSEPDSDPPPLDEELQEDATSEPEPITPVQPDQKDDLETSDPPVVETTAEVSPSPVLISQPHAVKTMLISVGALVSRSGTTHTAIQAAYEASKGHKHKTALVDLYSEQKRSDLRYLLSHPGTENVERVNGIDIYPEQSEKQLMDIIATGKYEVVVIDLGVLVDPADQRLLKITEYYWFTRSDVALLTLPVAPWDIARWINLLPNVWQNHKRNAVTILNYTDDERTALCAALLKEYCSIVVPNITAADPFTEEGRLLEGQLVGKPRKKGWFR
ncbi:hypothetical protein [Paenibacillus hunanensis]|uniref:Uncharacterized protein n=1 Tax=Paenibacillus hunanensis TaxID=539262 RepID=A0ABU1IZ11_9BACL|nr:hypothetical protein [Paenibacillus hunanensis]MDR6243458.1 hypothetical protein [Paenibacillus hunanensis]GGI97872.1 hypothetical protein GCM10008022_03210 [Paenibacillus hunanensis]